MPNRTIQNIFKSYAKFLDASPQPLKNRRAIRCISQCRTRDNGVSYYACNDGHDPVECCHSCRNRSCSICAAHTRLKWVDFQSKRIFNAPHFHVIFTLPHEYLDLWRYNEKLMSSLIFNASKETLMTLMADPEHHGVTPGILMVLHTWGRQLTLHPHTHCLVTAGGLDQKEEWNGIDSYLLPINVIKKFYRGCFQRSLLAAFKAGDLNLPPDKNISWFWQQYKAANKKNWVVRIQDRYDHGRGVLLYLSRYLKGGAVHPSQVRVRNDQKVDLAYLDHHDQRRKTLTLDIPEFLRRALSHVPPVGSHTVRYYGLYSSSSKRKREHCIAKLGTISDEGLPASLTIKDMLLLCPTCGKSTRLIGQVWKGALKGNSLYKQRNGLHVQQVDDGGLKAAQFG